MAGFPGPFTLPSPPWAFRDELTPRWCLQMLRVPCPAAPPPLSSLRRRKCLRCLRRKQPGTWDLGGQPPEQYRPWSLGKACPWPSSPVGMLPEEMRTENSFLQPQSFLPSPAKSRGPSRLYCPRPGVHLQLHQCSLSSPKHTSLIIPTYMLLCSDCPSLPDTILPYGKKLDTKVHV